MDTMELLLALVIVMIPNSVMNVHNTEHSEQVLLVVMGQESGSPSSHLHCSLH